jgi:hypothetical protein
VVAAAEVESLVVVDLEVVDLEVEMEEVEDKPEIP